MSGQWGNAKRRHIFRSIQIGSANATTVKIVAHIKKGINSETERWRLYWIIRENRLNIRIISWSRFIWFDDNATGAEQKECYKFSGMQNAF